MSREAEHGIQYAVKLTTGRFASQLILLGSALILPRFMGAEGYGRYLAWMAVIAILRSATTLGLPMVEVRFLAPLWRLDRRHEALTLGSTIWTSKLVVSVLGGLAMVLWLSFSPQLISGGALVFGLGLAGCLSCIHEGTISLYLPLGRVGALSIFLMARAFLTLAVVLCTYAWLGLAGVAWGLVILYIGLATGSSVFLLRTADFRPSRFSWASLAPHIPFSLAVYVGTVAWTVQGQFSIYAVANWATVEQAAFLGLTLQLYSFLQTLLFSAKRALTPVLAQLEAQGQEQRLRRWGDVMMRYSIAGSCLLILGWTFLGSDFIRLAFGETFLPVYSSAVVILVAVLFSCCAECCAVLLYIRGHARSASTNLLIFAALTIGGVFWALRGIEAGTADRVAWAYCAAALIYSLLSYLALGLRGRLWLPLGRSLLLALPAVGAGAATWQASLGPRLATLSALLVAYAAIAVALGLLPWNELSNLIRRALRRKSEPAAPPPP